MMLPGLQDTPASGLDPAWFAGVVFLLTYTVIMSERVNRAVVALVAGGVMVLGGVITQQEALEGIDFNTLGLLTGMMVIVAITRKSGSSSFWRSGPPRRWGPVRGGSW